MRGYEIAWGTSGSTFEITDQSHHRQWRRMFILAEACEPMWTACFDRRNPNVNFSSGFCVHASTLTPLYQTHHTRLLITVPPSSVRLQTPMLVWCTSHHASAKVRRPWCWLANFPLLLRRLVPSFYPSWLSPALWMTSAPLNSGSHSELLKIT